MTDLEMTRLCAEASGIEMHPHYSPLTNDAQAMALVKRFNIWLTAFPSEEGWRAEIQEDPYFEGVHHDLNRAIVECVARMQSAKSPPGGEG